MLSLYETLVRPYAQYYFGVWSRYYVQKRQSIDRKGSACKMIVGKIINSKPHEKQIRHLGLWTFPESRKKPDFTEISKCIKVFLGSHYKICLCKWHQKGNKVALVQSNQYSMCKCYNILLSIFSRKVMNRWNMLDQQTVDALTST